MTSSVAIVGGGASGALLVLQLLRQATGPLRILWFDTNNRFCQGLAYATTEDAHLLNVRASNMSVFADDPGHFVSWLHQGGYAYGAADFVPRRIYGLYILDAFRALCRQHPHVEVLCLAEEVRSLERLPDGFRLQAAQSYHAARVVLALGNFLPGHPRSADRSFQSSPWYFQNAFDPRVLGAEVLAQPHLTIIGAGLTMIDVVLGLYQRGYRERISTISPHGYLPQAQAEQALAPYPDFIDPGRNYHLNELLRLVNATLKTARREGRNPYTVIDALRPHVQRLWLGFSLDDQSRFLRHLRHKWGVARHRAPAGSMQVIAELMRSGRMDVLKGRIFEIGMTEPDGFRLAYRDGQGQEQYLDTPVLINCTGPEPDFNKLDAPLVKQLITSGLIEGHPLACGVKASAGGELSQGLYTIGPPLKGVLWESTAVPEIRLQAAVLAGKLF